MGRSSSFQWGVFGILCLTALSPGMARAEMGLPSDFGPVSIDASRRELEARMQDWRDDLEEARPERAVRCALAKAESWVTWIAIAPAVPLAFLQGLPGLLAAPVSGMEPATPLRLPLAELASQVALTSVERGQLERLQARRVEDGEDLVRLHIDTVALLMRVSARLYQERIDAHLARSKGFSNLLRADAELCAAQTLRIERDERMTEAAGRILAYYDFLEAQPLN